MKKYFLILIILFLFMGVSDCYAATLDCNAGTLRKGYSGERVRVLQTMLNEKQKCGLAVDGIFGNKTETCVKNYQASHGLTVDGLVGRNTCKSLNGGSSTSAFTNYTDSNDYAVVTGDYVNIRSKATTSSTKITQVTRGTIINTHETTGNWTRVTLSNGKKGYINKKYIASTVILVDISEQKFTLFKNGTKSWSTNVVTGNNGNHNTPYGYYTMNRSNFETDRILRGTNDNGSSYAAFVNYWMPFINSRGIGFHDATWRSAWGKSAYKGNGSHGCVNMQYDAAKRLYNEAPNSIGVIIAP